MLEIEIDNYNLDNTFKPSFLSSLYERRNEGEWVKLRDFPFKNIRIKQIGRTISVEFEDEDLSEVDPEDFFELELGLWFDPTSELEMLDERDIEVVERILSMFPGVRITSSPLEKGEILLAVLLNRNTSYGNVRRWMKTIIEETGGDPLEIAFLESDRLRESVGGSYQIFDSARIIKDLIELHGGREGLEKFLSKDPIILRRDLVKIRGLGPKSADSWLLFARGFLEAAACDRHSRLAIRLGLVPDLDLPEKRLCSLYLCDPDQCPRAAETQEILDRGRREGKRGCLRAAFTLRFGKLAGWIQTLMYLLGSELCSRKLCGSCELEDHCGKTSSGS